MTAKSRRSGNNKGLSAFVKCRPIGWVAGDGRQRRRGIIRYINIAALMACMAIVGCQSKPAVSSNSPAAANASIASPDNPSRETVAPPRDAAVALAAVQSTQEPWKFTDFDGLVLSTPHYRIYTTIRHDNIIERLPSFYESALTNYTTALAALPMPSESLETYLFQDRRQWQTKTRQLLPDQANTFMNLGRGGYTTKGTSVLYYIDYYGYTRDTFAIAAHEGWHQYTQMTFKQQLPVWLEEGVATYMEGYRTVDGVPKFQAAANWERRNELREAFREDAMIPLEELLGGTPQSFLNQGKNSLLVYYAQVWALTRFLAEGEEGAYHAALSEVLVDAAEGRLNGRLMKNRTASNNGPRRGWAITNRLGPAVVLEYFNPDMAEFERQYLAFAKRLAESSPRPRGGSQGGQ
jgi:hypothetical protein